MILVLDMSVKKEVREIRYRKDIDDKRDIEIIVRNDITWSIREIRFCGNYDKLDVPVWTIPHLIELLNKIYEDLEGGQ